MLLADRGFSTVSAKVLNEEVKKKIFDSQKNEITEYHIYDKLSNSVKDAYNKKILKLISKDELDHYYFWKKITKVDVNPNKLKAWMYILIARIFGITFGIKLMERGEEQAQITYKEISKSVPKAKAIVDDEDEHEKKLINMIDEDRLKYVGSMVRGLSDALVELTGALAGFTLALQNRSLIVMIGLITGIAACLSMAASEYLATKSEESGLNPIKASFYTSIAFFLTVMLLISPFIFFSNVFLSLGITIFNAIMIIFVFSFYISIAKDISFKSRFSEMVLISLGIAGLTFCIGLLARTYLHIEV
jgi:VIT1/CCC1 family predicted Fe2+/Mn2+ transporter